eukprot:3532544-Pyramimonas_sp.AAC.1
MLKAAKLAAWFFCQLSGVSAGRGFVYKNRLRADGFAQVEATYGALPETVFRNRSWARSRSLTHSRKSSFWLFQPARDRGRDIPCSHKSGAVLFRQGQDIRQICNGA